MIINKFNILAILCTAWVLTACGQQSFQGSTNFSNSSSTVGNGGKGGTVLLNQPTVEFLANPLIINQGQTSVLSWTSKNAAYCTTPSGDNKISGTFTTPALTATSTFSITCFGAIGSGYDLPTTKTVTIQVQNSSVNPAEVPTVRLMASASAVNAGEPVSFVWSSLNATSCVTPWSSNAGTNGTMTVNSLSATQTFIVACAGPAGTGNATVIVAVNPATPPPNASLATIQHRTLDMSKVLIFWEFFHGGRYERYHHLLVLKGATASLRFYSYDWNKQVKRPFAVPVYRLLVDGVEKATLNVTPALNEGYFTLDLSTVSEGWHFLDIIGAPDEQGIPYPVYVQKSAAPVNTDHMPFYMGTHTLAHGTHGAYYYGTVPVRHTPTSLPFEQRDTPAFNTPLPRKELVQTEILPSRGNDLYRPNMTSTGLMTTMNRQEYFFSDLVATHPRIPLLDGPRGQGNIVMPTHVYLGRSNNLYIADPWRVTKVTPDGHVKTLAGYRHKSVPSYWEGPQDLDLVGDWSQIPAERRGFHEIWGLAWDKRTLGQNIGSALINGELPHIHGPRLFVADSQKNRVVLLTFSAFSHDVEPVVTEFITGLNDPWDVVADNGVLYVSERKAHRIAAYDATTGQYLRTVVSGADLATVDRNRFLVMKSDVETLRKEQVVLPEGLFIYKGWLYYASNAMRQVKRVNLATGAIEWVANLLADNNSNYAKIAVGDGTFGPEGTVFVTTWSVNNMGFPHAYLPGGSIWNYRDKAGEKGLPWNTHSYAAAVAVGQGKLVFGNANEGVRMISKALPTDMVIDLAKYNAGLSEYNSKGWNVLYGPDGFGYYGLGLPWGQSANVDYFLTMNGHKK